MIPDSAANTDPRNAPTPAVEGASVSNSPSLQQCISVDDFTTSWLQLDGSLLQGVLMRTSIMWAGNGRARLAMSLDLPQESKTFSMSLYLKNQEKGPSPIALFNTQVQSTDAYEYYVDVISLLRSLSPPKTRLITFVRQAESLQELEQRGISGVTPGNLPLVQFFRAAGWKLGSISEVPSASDPDRRFGIAFETP